MTFEHNPKIPRNFGKKNALEYAVLFLNISQTRIIEIHHPLDRIQGSKSINISFFQRYCMGYL